MVSDGFSIVPHFGTSVIFGASLGCDARHQDVVARHRRLQFLAQHAAPAHRLHIVGGADEAAQRQPVAEQLAVVVEPRLQPRLVDRIRLGDR